MIDWQYFHFIRPWWLLALIPWFAALLLTLRHKLQRGNWSTVCDEPLLPHILQDKVQNRSRMTLTAGALAALLTIFALAGPAWERLPSPVFRDDSALVIGLDLSLSMDATDLKPSRLQRARFKIADILKQRKDGQTALLVYAGDAFTVTPLTADTQTIASQLSALTTDIMPVQGSNSVAAINHAIDLLKQAGMQKGHILLVTDGADIDKTEATVKNLGTYSLSILGVGTAEGAPIGAPGGGFVKDGQGNIVVPKLNAGELKKLAALGNGIYRTISPNDSDIETLLSGFENRQVQSDAGDDDLLLELWAERGPWLLLLILPLAALSFRKGVLSIAMLLVLPFPNRAEAQDWQSLWKTPNQQAQQAFEAGDYERAAGLFNDLEWKAAAEYKLGSYEQVLETLKDSDSARAHYNRGNALAQSGRLADAVTAYEEALKLDPDHEDAAFNKSVVEKELEKQQQEQQQGQDQNDKDHQQDSEQNDQGEPSEESGDDEAQDQNEQTDDQDRQRSSPEPQDIEEGQDDPEQDEGQVQEQNDETPDDQGKEEVAIQETEPADEAKQASEQWLKRIPDDPAGLLKRKFQYQYGRRGRQQQQDEAW
ncbi:VWA domain-containing protein [Methylotuvimicrobium alcaliphilum]|uniref:von Willebrand factor type A n=1 Tax=Methylotuvimicrobium alcaliphilum (strain DSM 19304 / NCIMB 14124 / VKM B-2133 / 20Z) TaxID=1091494 RepID=G4T1D2_META2|nr:VWA domain-containing protein [Methylotuvimicrobium alcaliphilum]CCE25681.1 von Willebrand factor type A [Methylotuvimicrobium alcaliphilum 20Z]